jgi:hypothetical protein
MEVTFGRVPKEEAAEAPGSSKSGSAPSASGGTLLSPASGGSSVKTVSGSHTPTGLQTHGDGQSL